MKEKAQTRFDDPAKRRVKRTKQSFTSMARALNANIAVGNGAKRPSVKRQTPDQSRVAPSTARRTVTRTPDNAGSALRNQIETTVVRKVSFSDFLDNLKAKLVKRKFCQTSDVTSLLLTITYHPHCSG